MTEPRRRRKKKRAFTLVELLWIAVIIGLLAALLVPIYQKLMQRAKIMQTRQLIENLCRAIELYYKDMGFYPGDDESAGYETGFGDGSYANAQLGIWAKGADPGYAIKDQWYPVNAHHQAEGGGPGSSSYNEADDCWPEGSRALREALESTLTGTRYMPVITVTRAGCMDMYGYDSTGHYLDPWGRRIRYNSGSAPVTGVGYEYNIWSCGPDGFDNWGDMYCDFSDSPGISWGDDISNVKE